MTELLTHKNAIIYGAGGSLGSGVARTFAREGATVFLAGRRTGTRAGLGAWASPARLEGGRSPRAHLREPLS